MDNILEAMEVARAQRHQEFMTDLRTAAAAELEAEARQFIEDTRLESRDALRAIIYARDLAPDAPIPTALLAAIEGARKVVA